LGKTKASDRVDPIIALAMATLAAVQAGKSEHLDPAYCRSVSGPIRAKKDGPFAAQDRAQAAFARRWTPRVHGFKGF